MVHIGFIKSPFKKLENMPIQSVGAQSTEGSVHIYPDFVQGLKDLDGFSHIYAIYEFHKSNNYNLIVKPFLDDTKRGLFSTRAPKRPNPIGLSIFNIVKVINETILVKGVDVLDGTPLLDIKPYVSKFDIIHNSKNGWLEKTMNKSDTIVSDKRFK
ncbi:MAG: tRNA (N6-threonylcarbamoyladenosine(37)-N6)-methyltransferase TrmO [Desulfobacteraceae bacterium]|nr:tRNA (N6-threonylcarbamoyladenosine(37)-N6)-methyltransferase TrmO [Desulfobacteraceae bacterium]